MTEVIWRTLGMYGLAIVVSLVIALVIRAVVSVLQAMERRPAPEPVMASMPQPIDVSADHVAAISAAIYAVMGAHRIVHIEAAHRGAGWVTEGRAAHHVSHTVSRHPHSRH